MRLIILLLLFIGYSSLTISQNDAVPRGPYNILSGGVIDGVVVKDEVPVRTAVQYEHVRAADLVWSKRVYSRIDAREKINHDIFFPREKILASFTLDPIQKPEDIVNHKGWIRNQERLSLWTIIMQHLMSGDLTMYFVSDTLDEKFTEEDGYLFKYRLDNKGISNIYFDVNSPHYKAQINKRIGIYMDGEPWTGDYQGGSTTWRTNPKFKTFNAWVNDLLNNDYDALGVGPQWTSSLNTLKANPAFEKAWNKAMNDPAAGTNAIDLLVESQTYYLTSDLVTAYDIKEDWYFDKERSVLDRRIIAIAPVAKFVYEKDKTKSQSGRSGLIVKSPYSDDQLLSANLIGEKIPVTADTETAEYELFWLYFPELRRVMVNYYVYNDQNDAQWMSLDDLFWKRKFNSQIYRVSDRLDREIEDFKFGVDALYEAEKAKEKIREWEINVWEY